MRHDEANDHASPKLIGEETLGNLLFIYCNCPNQKAFSFMLGKKKLHGPPGDKSGVIGLRSAGRQNKPSPLLTRPTRATKSSARDQSTRAAKLQYVSQGTRSSANPHRQPDGVQGRSLFVRSCGAREDVAPYPARILT